MKFITGVIVGMLILGCVGAALLFGIVPFPGTPTVAAAPPSQPLTQASTTPDMTVTLSEHFLNAQITTAMANGGQISNVSLDLHPGNIAAIHFTMGINSLFSVSPTANVLFGTSNGRITLTIQSVDVGGFGVPSALIDPIVQNIQATAEAQLNAQMATLQQTTGLRPQSISTTEDSITLTFAP